MKIVEIRESTRPIKSDIRNAYIDFSKMTLSLVAVVTDVIRDGKPLPDDSPPQNLLIFFGLAGSSAMHLSLLNSAKYLLTGFSPAFSWPFTWATAGSNDPWM
jgi:hypothetical protein